MEAAAERPLSAREGAGRLLDAVLVLELSGEDSPLEVRELSARNMHVTAIDASMAAQPWPRLEAVSLSQNPQLGESAVQLWPWLGQCNTLRCLNLNFCNLASLEGVQELKLLEQLFVSTNRVADVSPLGGCPELRALVLHRNSLDDVDACIATLGALKQLRELDLSGNPMWFRPECKHRHVAEIPTLRRYDDEELTDLDRELAAEALSGGKFRLPRPCPRPSDRAAARAGSDGAAAPAEGSRPSTAPVSSGRLTVPFRLPAGQPSSPTVPSPPPSSHSPRGRGSPTARPQPSGAAASDAAASDAVNVIGLGSTGGSFVQRLRKSTAVLSEPVTPIPCAAAVPSLDECLADPTRGVHTLYAIVQELGYKLAARPEPQPAAPRLAPERPPTDVVKALEKENAMLKLENSNMYFLKRENDELKAQQALQPQRGGQAEVEKLRGELEVLRTNYMVLLQGSGEQERPQTAAEVIATCESEYDSDLAELFRRNERGLAETKQELKLLQEEMEPRGDGAAAGTPQVPIPT